MIHHLVLILMVIKSGLEPQAHLELNEHMNLSLSHILLCHKLIYAVHVSLYFTW